MEKEVEITWEGKSAKVVVGEITFGELFEIMKAVRKSRIVNGMTIEETDENEMALQILLKSIKSAPFEVNRENIYKLSGRDGAKLMQISAEINTFQNNESIERRAEHV